jgi:hypothetical protein
MLPGGTPAAWSRRHGARPDAAAATSARATLLQLLLLQLLQRATCPACCCCCCGGWCVLFLLLGACIQQVQPQAVLLHQRLQVSLVRLHHHARLLEARLAQLSCGLTAAQSSLLPPHQLLQPSRRGVVRRERCGQLLRRKARVLLLHLGDGLR